MEFEFSKITDKVSETFKKKPALVLGVVGGIAGLAFLLIRSRTAQTAATETVTTYDQTADSQQAAQGAASNAQLYSDVYGLVAQAQDATLQKVESMMESNNTALYNALQSNLNDSQQETASQVSGLSSMFTQSLAEWSSKFSALGSDPYAAAQPQQTAPSTNYSSPAPATVVKPKTTVSAATTSNLLKTGSRGQSVSLLQSKLNSLGFSAGSVDGIYGSKTTAAVKAFQQAAGITADGIVGPQTQAALSTYRPTGATR